ncbi:uncharacterized protein LOC116159617 isoform X2 [Photinus pyralis]|uniref:uncharacterized protein LOC116159617 isoform X2 n=1 Tax=Photinus pyralis TaxID=7054 RepID=UPI0012672C52|nr:uncharacterized protein LOC116159617 isoform X2 [Photinus pyralis]
MLANPALTNLELEKACKANEGYNDTVCDSILSGTFKENNLTEENRLVQQHIVQMHSWQSPLQSVMPIILVLFLGSYSDRHKIRKPFLLLPIFGEFFAVAGCILCVIFMRELPLEFQGFAQTVVPSFLGGPTMIIMAAFAYIADVSTLEMRTLRVGVVQIVLNVWTPIVQSFSGILFSAIGYIGILIIGAIFYVIGFAYGLFWIKEPKQPVGLEDKKSLIKDIFDPHHAIETFKVLIKKTEGNERVGILLIMVILFIYAGVINGEGSVFFLFTQTVYEWTVVEFSYLLTFNTIIHLVGTVVALPIFTTVLKLNDLVITVISFLDKIIANFVFATVLSTTGLYAGIAVSIIIGVATISIRSQATKIVSEDDLGKAQSLFAIVEAISPMICVPLYNEGLYSYTIDDYPQAFFFLGIGLYAVGIVILLWLYLRERKRRVPAQSNGVGDSEKSKDIVIIETTHM